MRKRLEGMHYVGQTYYTVNHMWVKWGSRAACGPLIQFSAARNIVFKSKVMWPTTVRIVRTKFTTNVHGANGKVTKYWHIPHRWIVFFALFDWFLYLGMFKMFCLQMTSPDDKPTFREIVLKILRKVCVKTMWGICRNSYSLQWIIVIKNWKRFNCHPVIHSWRFKTQRYVGYIGAHIQ